MYHYNNPQGRIYVANECPTYAKNIYRLSIKNVGFLAKLFWIENKSVCFDKKQANVSLKHANSSIFQHIL
mgnify:CR=1 FL=1